jgi:hypothetical protein
VGSRAFEHDLMTLHNLWLAPTQMLQVAPGHLWCSCCGNVRPKTYFDPATFDDEDEPLTYSKWCKECANAHDPKLRSTCFCSGCKLEKRRELFGDDDRNASGKKSICHDCDKRDARERRERKAEEQGRTLRGYQWAR